MKPWPLHRCAEALIEAKKQLEASKERLSILKKKQEDLEWEIRRAEQQIFRDESSVKHWIEEIERSFVRLEAMK